MDDGETRGMVTCPCGWFKPRAYFRDLHEHQDTHRQEQDREERFAIITAAVAAIVPNVQNETAAWNTWNNLASSDDFRKAIVMIDRDRQWAAHESTEPPEESGQRSGECEHGDHGACDGTTRSWPCECSCHPLPCSEECDWCGENMPAPGSSEQESTDG